MANFASKIRRLLSVDFEKIILFDLELNCTVK
jgi:hypothetical protein